MKDCGIPCTKLKESVGKSLGLQFGLPGSIALAAPKDRVAEAEAVILYMDVPAGN